MHLTPVKHRIASIDLLKGLVMVVMALDHVRDYFHADAFLYDPADPTRTTLFLFFTRWITHFCAPAFSFLAGISAFMAGKRRTPAQLSVFLLKRGLWLILLELTLISFAWYFDIYFKTTGLLVIWSLGVSMVVLAALVHTPRNFILFFSLLLICCHNLLDGIHFRGSLLWAIVHDQTFFNLENNTHLLVGYPLIPWVAVMALGYYFGHFYENSFDSTRRQQLFNRLGLAALALFLLLRGFNLYGNPTPWKPYDTPTQAIISFLNPNKYPPSLLYLLMTLGGSLLFLANTENLRGKVVAFFSTFGRVPFFYYILHLYLIHILALLFAELSGFGWQKMILPNFIFLVPEMRGYGFPLWVVYAVWIGIVALLYPLCLWFDRYKKANPEKWWLSYL